MYEDLKWPEDMPQTTVGCIDCSNWYIAKVQTVNNVHVTSEPCNRCGSRITQTEPPYYVQTKS